MTVFVVSLFLPYTINFQLPSSARSGNTRQQPPIRTASQDPSGTTLSLLNPQSQPTPPATPAASSDENIFFAQDQAPPGGQPLGVQTRVLNQPRSQASSLPRASLVDHGRKSDTGLGLVRGVAMDKAYDGSDDSFFASAEWKVEPADQGNDGLKNAVKAAEHAGYLKEKTWVGTMGMPTNALDAQQKTEIQERLETDFDSLAVIVDDSDFDGHYSHYCKTILWPVFHYQIPDNPKSKAYEDHSWVYYVKVNQAFADRIVKSYKRGDIIWIHDYHLLLVPLMVRKRLPDAQIGFFLHAAFPSSEVFRCLAVRNQLLEGMLGANLVGLQTEEYCRHFVQTCSRILCVEATSNRVELEDRFVNVADFPIGIDPSFLSSTRESPVVSEWVKIISERYRGKRLIVARDQLDHIRGVRQKLLAYELFLNKYPQWRNKVVLLQVATSTTEQAELDATVSDIVTRVNSTHSTLAHQPLVFLKQDISFEQYLALLMVAEALMVTSLREGMDLTSHDFVFLQDGKYNGNKYGSLILSEFTGSASVFEGSELSVNPWNYRQCAEAIRTALEMSAEEREKRWKALYDKVTHLTAGHWFQSFLVRLQDVWKDQSARDTLSVPRLSITLLQERYNSSVGSRVFILDYEGTLASYGTPTSIFLTCPPRTLDVLSDLMSDNQNIVYVMSGRTPEELDRLFRILPNLGLIAENGCFIKEFGTETWTEMADMEKMSAWKESVRNIVEYYRERIEGSFVEERHCSLIFNYSKSEDLQVAGRQAGDCANHINDACQNQRIHAVPIDGAVLIEPFDWSKGTAATHIFEGLKKRSAEAKGGPGPEFLLVAGDDREDEVIFRWANSMARTGAIKHVMTVSVGSRNTEAMTTLPQGVTGVLSALHKLTAN